MPMPGKEFQKRLDKLSSKKQEIVKRKLKTLKAKQDHEDRKDANQ